jgi:hypothetical protein
LVIFNKKSLRRIILYRKMENDAKFIKEFDIVRREHNCYFDNVAPTNPFYERFTRNRQILNYFPNGVTDEYEIYRDKNLNYVIVYHGEDDAHWVLGYNSYEINTSVKIVEFTKTLLSQWFTKNVIFIKDNYFTLKQAHEDLTDWLEGENIKAKITQKALKEFLTESISKPQEKKIDNRFLKNVWTGVKLT